MAYQGYAAPILVGTDGLTGSQNLDALSPGQLLQATNLTYESGSLQKEGGAAKFNAASFGATTIVLAGADWWPNPTTQYTLVYLSDGTVRRDNDGSGAFATTMTSAALPHRPFPIFLAGGQEAAARPRKLFVLTGQAPIQVITDGSAIMTGLALPPIDWSGSNQPSTADIHLGRLWCAGNANDPHRVYYSTIENHEDFQSAGTGSLSIFPGEGEGIVQLLSFKGLLLIFKSPAGVYAADTRDANVINWGRSRLSNTVGGVSASCAVQLENDVLFWGNGGQIQLLSGIQEYGLIGMRSLSQQAFLLPLLRAAIDFTQISQIRCVYYSAKREAHFVAPGKVSGLIDQRLVVDFAAVNARFRLSDRDTCPALWLRKDATMVQRPTIGDYAGTVWLLDQAARDKNGAAYTSTFQTPWLDFSFLDPSLGYKRKNAQFLEVVHSSDIVPSTLYTDMYWDGRYVETVSVPLAPYGAVLGVFVVGTDSLASAAIQSPRVELHGGGKRCSMIFRHNDPTANFNISRVFVEFSVSDERGTNA